jgi:hypothetical protein
MADTPDPEPNSIGVREGKFSVDGSVAGINAAVGKVLAPADATLPANVVVPLSPLSLQLQAQVRIVVAALAGGIVTAAASRLKLPVLTTLWGVQGEQVVGAVTGVVMLAGMSAWSWAKNKWMHRDLASIAADPRVPNEVARLARSVTSTL